MRIEDCKDITDYLRICNVQLVDELSDEQVFSWAKSGKMGIKTQNSVFMVEYGLHRRKPNKEKAIKLLKQAIIENKVFVCSYRIRESCDGLEDISDRDEYFGMSII